MDSTVIQDLSPEFSLLKTSLRALHEEFNFSRGSCIVDNARLHAQVTLCTKKSFISGKLFILKRTGLLYITIIIIIIEASLVAQIVNNLPTMQETQVPSLGQEDPLEKAVSTQSSVPACRTPSTEEPGRFTVHGSTKS